MGQKEGVPEIDLAVTRSRMFTAWDKRKAYQRWTWQLQSLEKERASTSQQRNLHGKST